MLSAKLSEQGILTALDVARMPAAKARDEWSVVLERTGRELHKPGAITAATACNPARRGLLRVERHEDIRLALPAPRAHSLTTCRIP